MRPPTRTLPTLHTLPTPTLLALLLPTQALANFNWTATPSTSQIGQTVQLSWEGNVGGVTIYMKKDPYPESKRFYVYGDGQDGSGFGRVYEYAYTIPVEADPGRTYVFEAWDLVVGGPYYSKPMFLDDGAALEEASVSRIRGRGGCFWDS